MGNSWLIRDFVLENASTTFDGCFLRLIEGFSSGLERIGNTQSSVNYFNRIIFDDTPTGEKQRIFFFLQRIRDFALEKILVTFDVFSVAD